MAKRSKKDELQDKVLNYLETALTENEEILANSEDNFKAYMMEKYGNEVKGRSAFVTSDVADTIEWIMPSLMKLFYGGQQVVEIRPTGASDEEKAKAMNAKINFDFMQQQNGFIVLHDWFKSALLNKISAVKYWWEEEEIRETKEFEGLSPEELLALLSSPEFDQDSAQISKDEETGLFDLEIQTVVTKEYPKAEVVPIEEFLFCLRSRTEPKESDFIAHRKRVHKNYLKSEYGVKDKDIERTVSYFDSGDTLKDTRFADLGGIEFITDDKDSDFVFIYECFVNDYDAKGKKVPTKVTVFGNQVLEIEENKYLRPNFCTLSSIRIPHRMAGVSIADQMFELQRLHTALIRAIMDNVYYQNNGINVVNPFRINMDDVINRKEPGAHWRTLHDIDPSTALMPVQPNPLAPQTFEMLGVLEDMKQKRSGLTDNTQGLDSHTLNKTATGISQIMGAAQQRLELIARIFAETGVKDLFEQFVFMNTRFLTQEQAVKVDDAWVDINPQDIQGSYDVLIDVGIGTGSKEIQINQLMTMINVSTPGMQMGYVTSENMYNLYKAVYELMGYKSTEKFISKPQIDPQVAQQMQQMQAVIAQQQEQLKMLMLQQEVEMEKLRVEWAKLALKEKEIEMKNEVDTADVISKAEYQRASLVQKSKVGTNA